jgi:hypothetical protein
MVTPTPRCLSRVLPLFATALRFAHPIFEFEFPAYLADRRREHLGPYEFHRSTIARDTAHRNSEKMLYSCAR